jgi:RNA polymerase sigma factor (sigma-70 family)
MGEAELIARFAAGEPAGVAQMYRTYGRLVYSVSRRMLGDPKLAEQATKRTFLLARTLAATIEPGRQFEPWLASIASATAMAVKGRHQGHRQSSDLAGGQALGPAIENSAAPDIGQAWRVRRALDALPTQDRELIRLQHLGRLTRKEISARLAIPLGSLNTRSEQAHRNLAELLGPSP